MNGPAAHSTDPRRYGGTGATEAARRGRERMRRIAADLRELASGCLAVARQNNQGFLTYCIDRCLRVLLNQFNKPQSEKRKCLFMCVRYER